MAQDEGRFGRINPPRSSWAPPKIRPRVANQKIREYFYVYSAVCPMSGEMTSLILPYASTEMMNIFLDQVSKDFSDYFIVMQTDQAGWHKSKDLKMPENIRLLYQPAYSPELNPVEHIWDELKEKFIQNITFETIKKVITAVCKGINQLSADLEKIKSMTYFPFFNVTF